jgi:sugar lactone lactonase YvrE
MLATEAHVETLVDGLDHPEGVCWDPDARCLYAGGEAGQLYRVELDRRTFEEVAQAPGPVLGLAVDGRGRIVLCCSGAGVHIWDGARVHELMTDVTFANFPAFGADGTLYVSDSGRWSENSGSIRAVDPDRSTRTLSADCPSFTNGLAVSPDGVWLWVAESYHPRVRRIEVATGLVEDVIDLEGTVPDGLAFTADGGLLISCYRPDRIYHLLRDGSLEVLAGDPQGTLLAAPTNVCFAGEDLDVVAVANLNRRHLTRIDSSLRGVPLHRPDHWGIDA